MIKKVQQGLKTVTACATVLILLCGCAGGKAGNGDGRLEYRLVKASEATPPAWINQPPDDAGGMHFMVGLSNHESTEVGARESAMRAARGEYARYTGVEVADVDEVERFLNAKESEVFDAQVAGKLSSKQTTNAMVSRIKAKNYYIETYNVLRAGDMVGTAFRCSVLVTIPADEDKRVAEWKQSLKRDAAASESRAEQAADAVIQGIESHARSVFTESDQLAWRGQVLPALSLLANESERLVGEQSRVAGGDSRLNKRLYRVEALQRDVQQQANLLVQNLLVEGGRFSTVYIDAGLPGQTLRGWVWFRSANGLMPVGGLPVRIVSQSGQVLAQAITNASGRADFSTSMLDSAVYRFELDADHRTLSRILSLLRLDVAATGSNFNIVKACNDVPGATSYAVSQLFSGSTTQPLPAHKLFMGPVTYKDTNVGGNFSSLVQRYLKQSLASVDGLTVVAPRKRDVENVKQAVRTRGIAVVEKAQQGAPSLGDASVQAVIDGAEAALVAQYDVQPDGVLLDLSLKEAGTDILLAAATARIDRRSIPFGTELIPPSDAPFQPMQKPSGGALRVEITTHLGNGQTFQEGDVVTFFAHLDQSAYLLLVYEDADGNLIQVFPNRYADNRVFPAGTTIEVPGKKDTFEFDITAPFGHERVYAFAATRAFKVPQGTRLENGLFLFSCSRDELFSTLRSVSRTPGTAYGESSTVLTTVPKTY